MYYLAHGSYSSGTGIDSADSTTVVIAGLGMLAIGLVLGYVLGAGRVPGFKPPKKTKK